MPEVLRMNGFVLSIYPRDHPPPHVHVWRSGSQVKVTIPLGDSPPDVVGRNRFGPRDTAAAIALVAAHPDYLLHQWGEIHGQTRTD